MIKAIEIINLKKYFKDVKAVDGINLDINQGEIFGFVGQNGAGKSTTIRTLLNMLYPTSGEAKILGLDIVKDIKEIKGYVSYVPSEVEYYTNMKVYQLFNYAKGFVKDLDNSRIDSLCEYFELDKNRNIKELSLGNRKKVSLIQALIKNPKVIILDEPTSGLDPLMQEKLFKILLEEKKKNVAIFLSSHNLSEVQKYCDRVAIIKSGKIVELTEVDKIIKRNIKKVSYTTTSGDKKSFLWKDNINDLFKILDKEEIEDLEIVSPTIEDEFKKYYGDNNEE